MLAEHQLSAVSSLASIIERYGGALLADAPGTGKTYVAVALALQHVERGATVEIVAPPSLLAQWRTTLDEFGVEAKLFSHDRLAHEPHLPKPSARLLIVDEAHAFRNPATRRYDALARRSIGARVLLITATPLCNRATELQALLALIACDDALAASGVPSIEVMFERKDYGFISLALSRLMVRRGREVVPPALQFGALRKHRVEYSLASFADVIRAVGQLSFPLLPQPALLRRVMLYRLQSSLDALRESLGRQLRFYERALDALRCGRTLTRRDYARIFRREAAEAASQQVLFWDLFVDAPGAADAVELEAEIERLVALQSLTVGLESAKITRVRAIVAEAEGPVLVFTNAIATARALERELRSIAPVALATGSARTDATRAIEAFTSGRVDVLVATDLVSEGLNLQRAAVVVHYDLPWNPVRLDQRNGRAHRIGQRRSAVEAYYFVPDPDLCGVHEIALRKTRLRARIDSTAASAAPNSRPTLRPRLRLQEPQIRLVAAAARAGFDLSAINLRRRRIGLERMMAELAGELLTAAKIRDLQQLIATEP